MVPSLNKGGGLDVRMGIRLSKILSVVNYMDPSLGCMPPAPFACQVEEDKKIMH